MTVAGRPARWWIVLSGVTAVLVGLVCGVIVWTFVPPVVFFPWFALASWVLLILGAVWLVVGLVGWFKFRALRVTAIAPALVLATAVLVVWSVPSTVAFAVSKGSLVAASAQCAPSWDGRRIGVYQVRRIQPVDGGCLFYIEGGLIDPIGLAYLPGGAPYLGKPRHDGDIGYEQYSGDWYRFVERF
ncbi:hypothetical membrane protein [Rhodococcus gordoniae]|uniref:Hypothetical membrane protein n=1 Tax=Rhodococcus gordoniae TaxID=223392 RepID=A0A379PNX1_9NOCA|nr:hypothetical protein [Rhodococcus gordoniae]SUF08999.1 hypothetical membrane protein [Rhodococcus gordoniae]